MKCESSQSPMLFDFIHNRIWLEHLLSPDSRGANFTIQVKGGILAGITYYCVPYDEITGSTVA